ncbi:DUF7507 domain-containing protein, partial [Dokdonella sp.]|uniref:DUF7507 domain-containing protein n=1 Tax=Dokdonella sp. TaxID=2291710 RepID=UPI0031C40B63|nr:hypothetical protein [Dokdonella sp.]
GTAPGTYAVSYTATVDSDASGSVGNSVVATGGTPPGGTPPSCSTCSTTHPLADPSINVTKSSDPVTGATVAAGQVITYTVTAQVSDAALTSDLVLTDTLSGDQTFASVTNPGSFSADTSAAPVLVFTLPSGTVPGTYAVEYTATVDADASDRVGNAVVAQGGSGIPPTCTMCSTTHPLEASVTLSKALTGEDGNVAGVAEPGERLTYTITLANSGGVVATGVGVTDQLDPNTQFVSADLGGSHVAGVVSWSALTVPAGGSLALTVVVDVVDPIPQGVTRIANLAYLDGSTPPACPPVGPQCVVTPTAPDVTVTKALSAESIVADGVAEPGEELTYTLTVRNYGGTPTTGTIVNETVPQHTVFVTGTPAWSCAAGAPAGTACDALVNVPAHDGVDAGMASLTFTVRVDDPLPAGVTSILNAVTVDDGTPPDCVALPGDPACVVTPTVNLRLTKTVAGVVSTGPSTFRIDYRIELVNLGGSPASYTLTDTPNFAPGVVFMGNAQVSSTGGTVNPALPGGQFAPVNGTGVQLSASGVAIAAGATHEYLLRVPIGVQPGALADPACDGTPGHGLYNSAAVTGTFNLESAACVPVDGDVALIHLVKQVTLAVDHDGDHYGDVGDVLGYTFTISNPGTLPLASVQLFDPRVQNLQCPPFTRDGHPFQVRFGDELFAGGFDGRAGGGSLQPGDAVTCIASYVLTASDVARARVVNSATAVGSGTAGQTVASVATAIFTAFR